MEGFPAANDGFSRSVCILGPHDRIDVAGLLGSFVASRRPELVLLSVGYPPTPAQQACVDAALAFAVRGGFDFQARLAWSMDDALDCLSPDDELLTATRERTLVSEMAAG